MGCGVVGVPGADAAAEVSILTRLQSRLLLDNESMQVLGASCPALPPGGRIVGAAGTFLCAQSLLSGSFLIVSTPMWFASPAVDVLPGFSLCCSSGSCCPRSSELLLLLLLWQSMGPLTLGGRRSSAAGPLGFRQSVHGLALHLNGEAPDEGAAEGGSEEHESGEGVRSEDCRGFRSSEGAQGLASTLCSRSRSVVDDAASEADAFFFLRWRMMLHWRAMTSWSHCRNTAEGLSSVCCSF